MLNHLHNTGQASYRQMQTKYDIVTILLLLLQNVLNRSFKNWNKMTHANWKCTKGDRNASVPLTYTEVFSFPSWIVSIILGICLLHICSYKSHRSRGLPLLSTASCSSASSASQPADHLRRFPGGRGDSDSGWRRAVPTAVRVVICWPSMSAR